MKTLTKIILCVILAAMWRIGQAQSQLVKDLVPGPDGITEVEWARAGAKGVVFSAGQWADACHIGVTDGSPTGTDWVGCAPYFLSANLLGTIEGQVIFSTFARDAQPYTVWASDGSNAEPQVIWQEPPGSQRTWSELNDSQLVAGKGCAIIHDDRHELTVIITDGTPEGTQVIDGIPDLLGHVHPSVVALDEQWVLTLERRVAGEETVTRYLVHPTTNTLTQLEQEVVPHRTHLRQWRVGNQFYALYHALPSFEGTPISWVTWRSLDSFSHPHRIDLVGAGGEALRLGTVVVREGGLLIMVQDSEARNQLWKVDSTGFRLVFDFPFPVREVWTIDDQLYLLVKEEQGSDAYPFPQKLYRFSLIDQSLTFILAVSQGRNRPISRIRTLGERTLIIATQEAEGTELWVTDGTAVGTEMLDAFWPGLPHGVQPKERYGLDYGWTPHEGVAYFPVASPGRGTELGRSDGTPEGTYLVSEDMTGFNSGHPGYLVAWQEKLLYLAQDGAHGNEWRVVTKETPPVSAPAANFEEDFAWMELIGLEARNVTYALRWTDMQANAQGEVLLFTYSTESLPALYYQNQQIALSEAEPLLFQPQMWLSRFDAAGTLRWTKRLPEFGPGAAHGNQMSLHDDGSAYLALTTPRLEALQIDDLPTFNDQDGLLLRLDAQGKATWGRGIRGGRRLIFHQVVSHATGAWILGEAVGNLQVDGETISPEPYHGNRSFLLHIGPSGEVRWEQNVRRDLGYWRMALSEDGRTLYTLEADTSRVEQRCGQAIPAFWVAEREASSGAVRWRQRIEGRFGHRAVSIAPKPQGGVWLTATLRGEVSVANRHLEADDCDTQLPYVLSFDGTGKLVSARVVQHPSAEGVDAHDAFQILSDQQGGYWWLGYDTKRDRAAAGPPFSYPFPSGESQLILEHVDGWDRLLASRRFRSFNLHFSNDGPYAARLAYHGGQFYLATTGVVGFDTVALTSAQPVTYSPRVVLTSFSADQVASVPGQPQLIEPAESPWLIGPNPSSGTLTLYPQQEGYVAYRFRLTDLTGRQVKQGTYDGNQRISTIDLRSLTPGIYHLEVEGGGVRVREKIIVQP